MMPPKLPSGLGAYGSIQNIECASFHMASSLRQLEFKIKCPGGHFWPPGELLGTEEEEGRLGKQMSTQDNVEPTGREQLLHYLPSADGHEIQP